MFQVLLSCVCVTLTLVNEPERKVDIEPARRATLSLRSVERLMVLCFALVLQLDLEDLLLCLCIYQRS